jgi:D-aminopeptidase
MNTPEKHDVAGPRPRARDLGIAIGSGIPGPLNAITDVAGVRVGHSTISHDLANGRCVRTGVTVVEPRGGMARLAPCFAGVHVLNGNGDASGLEWIREAGLLSSQIAITNTHSVGMVRDSLIALEHEAAGADDALYWSMPVVLETFDGILNDINGFHVSAAHVRQAVDAAQGGAVVEGAVGGGTGMICYELKGGIGTSSRRLAETEGAWTVGALVQANHGKRASFSVNGIPVGRRLNYEDVPPPFAWVKPSHAGSGSIVVVLATDAPLLPHQCKRLAQRASIGLARSGGGTEDSSGDIFIAFATGNRGLPVVDYARVSPATTPVTMVNNDHISPLFEAAAEAVEEAILNAMLAATTVEGCARRVAHALTAQMLTSALAGVRTA